MAFDDPFYANIPSTSDDAANNFYNEDDPAAEFLEREKRELADITGDNDTNFFNDPFAAKTNSLLSNGKIFFINLIFYHFII